MAAERLLIAHLRDQAFAQPAAVVGQLVSLSLDGLQG
jgi:hypothetical protein